MANKIKYGLSNVHVLFIESYDVNTKKYTYDQDGIQPVPGAVNLSLDPQGDLYEFFADNINYSSGSTNAGYQGDLEIAIIPDWLRKKALGEVVDENGVQLESADAVQKEFVMFFELDGDKSKRRFVLYRNTISRPAIKGQTTEKTKTPQTDSITLTTMARENDHFVKGFIDSDNVEKKEIYDKWYTEMHEPKFTQASASGTGSSTC